MDAVLRALNRFGQGARPGERRGLSDPRGWVLEQLDGAAPVLPHAGSLDVSAALRELRAAQSSADRAAAARARRKIVSLAAAEMDAVLTERLTTTTPVLERLVSFWSNHLCISASANLRVAALAGAYEREAIRPHVLGRFEDMVIASASHPAMLLYLDNAQSIGPQSRAARSQQRRRAGVRRGLNENHARELLELHTLGVDGGYTQQDVQELARILTGWTVSGLPASAGGRAGTIQHVFEPLLHEPGAKIVLGVRYEEAGADEGRRAIRALCRHPSTAQFIARKLVTHFVSDAPPAGAVEAVADAFTKSGGDLRETMRALVRRPEAWSGEHRKFRTPQDWLVAALRGLDADRSDGFVGVLRQLRHPLWSPPAPNGFGDTMQVWADPDSLLNRAELARTLARRVARGFPAQSLLDVVDTDAADPLRSMLVDDAVPADERVALAIAAPAFQWR